jgi:hypothetical protein
MGLVFPGRGRWDSSPLFLLHLWTRIPRALHSFLSSSDLTESLSAAAGTGSPLAGWKLCLDGGSPDCALVPGRCGPHAGLRTAGGHLGLPQDLQHLPSTQALIQGFPGQAVEGFVHWDLGSPTFLCWRERREEHFAHWRGGELWRHAANRGMGRTGEDP